MLKISIITVVKNNQYDIERCILSVISQNIAKSEYEYIVIDGKSTDRTLEIINNYKESIDLIISEADSGISSAFNKGIELATGCFVLFLSSDDFLYNSSCLKNISKDLAKSKDAYLYSIKLCSNVNADLVVHPPNNLSGIKSDMIFCHPAMVVKRSVLQNYLFDTSLKLAMDYDQSLQIYLNNHSFFTCDTILTVVSNTGVSHKNYISSRFECFKIQNKYFSFSYSLINLLKSICRYYVRLILVFIKMNYFVKIYQQKFSKNIKIQCR